MTIRIRDAAEFEKLLEAIASDALQAQDYRRLDKELVDARLEYSREFSQTGTFWWMTQRAHAEAVLYRLTRIYDKRQDSLSLQTWLDLVQENAHLFDERNFRQRLKSNPFVASLAEDARKPDLEQLARDRASVDKNEPVVKRLLSYRNTSLAHLDPDTLLGSGTSSDPPLTWPDIDILIERAISIVNRYSYLFRASVYAGKIVGHDDYKFLLRMVREWLAAHEASIQAELEKLKPTNG